MKKYFILLAIAAVAAVSCSKASTQDIVGGRSQEYNWGGYSYMMYIADNLTTDALDELEQGAEIVFLADLYDYDQNYTASYAFGKSITVDGELKVSSVYLPDKSKALVTYRITDIYQQAYWTPVIGK